MMNHPMKSSSYLLSPYQVDILIQVFPVILKIQSAQCDIELFNIIVFIRATHHVITMLCDVTKNWQKHFRFH